MKDHQDRTPAYVVSGGYVTHQPTGLRVPVPGGGGKRQLVRAHMRLKELVEKQQTAGS